MGDYCRPHAERSVMTSVKTEVIAWEEADPTTGGDVMVVRLSDYEDLKSAYEAELSQVRQVQVKQFSALTRAIEQIADMEAEIKKLRKDAEFGQSVLSKREPGKKYGCHCDLEEDMEPDGCVIDEGNPLDCVYARRIETKEQCEYWRVIASDASIPGVSDA